MAVAAIAAEGARVTEVRGGYDDAVRHAVVPAGVGSLAQAAVTHYRSRPGGRATALLTVESEAAACVLTSLRLGRRVSVPAGTTAMAGLKCGTPSSLAWPHLRGGLDAAVAVTDLDSAASARELTDLGISCGPCGAAALAGAATALTGPGSARRRADLGLEPTATVVLLSTEGRAANPVLSTRPDVQPGG